MPARHRGRASREGAVRLRVGQPRLGLRVAGRSPIVYLQDEVQAPRLRALAERHLSMERAYHHSLSMARGNLREHLLGETVRYKKYLYVLRPLLAARWIREGRGAPPMRFAELAQATLTDPALIAEINRLLEVKMRAGEAATSPRWEGLHGFIVSELEVAQAHRPVTGPAAGVGELDEMLRSCLGVEARHPPPATDCALGQAA